MERLDLNFRADEAAPPPRTPLAGGWWLWCLIGICVGLGCWWFSRQYLTRRLSDQLAAAQTPSEAFLALEGLLMLDPNSSLEIARGLQHPNAQVARAAYRTLDAQITGWQQLDATHAATRMRSLAQRLNELPKSTPLDNLVLASSLASRIFSICLELDDPQLAPVMTICESVFHRVGASQLALQKSEQEMLALQQDIGQFQPPPPLAGAPAAAPLPEIPSMTAATLSDQFTTQSLSDAEDALDPLPAASIADGNNADDRLTDDESGMVPPSSPAGAFIVRPVPRLQHTSTSYALPPGRVGLLSLAAAGPRFHCATPRSKCLAWIPNRSR